MRSNGNRIKQIVHTSVCGEFTLRGTAKQIYDKYLILAKDAAETEKQNLFQHAHHWATLI